jgi:hypothetical protein
MTFLRILRLIILFLKIKVDSLLSAEWFGRNFRKVAKIRQKDEKSTHFDRKLAARDSDEEIKSSDSTQSLSFWEKIWIWNIFLCRVRDVFRFFSRAKKEISQLHVAFKTRKTVLEPKSDARKRCKDIWLPQGTFHSKKLEFELQIELKTGGAGRKELKTKPLKAIPTHYSFKRGVQARDWPQGGPFSELKDTMEKLTYHGGGW